MCCYELFAHWKNFCDLISFKTILKRKQAKLGPHPSFRPSFLLFVRPSIHASVYPSVSPGVFLELCHWFFLIFGMVLESHVKLCVTEPIFRENCFCPKIGKWFFQFIGKFGNKFFLNLIYNKNLYYLLCSCTNPIFGKVFVPKIWAKMFSANQIAGFFNQLYFQNKSLK